jgi:hypothetical protein
MALKRRVRAEALEDVQNRHARAFPHGHTSEAELEEFFAKLPRHLFDNRGSMRTVPVEHSAGPLLEGCESLLLMSIF